MTCSSTLRLSLIIGRTCILPTYICRVLVTCGCALWLGHCENTIFTRDPKCHSRRRGSDRRPEREAERPGSRRREEPRQVASRQIQETQLQKRLNDLVGPSSSQDMKEVIDRQAEEELEPRKSGAANVCPCFFF